MKDLLKELSRIVDETPIESDAFSKMCYAEELLDEKLQGDDKRVFDEFIKAENQAAAEYSVIDFKRGFIAGCRLMRDVFGNDKAY